MGEWRRRRTASKNLFSRFHNKLFSSRNNKHGFFYFLHTSTCIRDSCWGREGGVSIEQPPMDVTWSLADREVVVVAYIEWIPATRTTWFSSIGHKFMASRFYKHSNTPWNTAAVFELPATSQQHPVQGVRDERRGRWKWCPYVCPLSDPRPGTRETTFLAVSRIWFQLHWCCILFAQLGLHFRIIRPNNRGVRICSFFTPFYYRQSPFYFCCAHISRSLHFSHSPLCRECLTR